MDPGLRKVARFLPRGNALHRGYKVQRTLMNLMGNAGRMRNVPVAAVNQHVTVRLQAPARRENLSGLPPTWIGVGILDLFHQECLGYGRRLREAGVPVHEKIVPGTFHAFDQIADKAPISVKFFASQRAHLRKALAPANP